LQVPLNRLRIARHCLAGVLAELAAGAPLAEQVPALIELDLHRLETLALVLRQRLLAVSVEQVLLFVDELVDPTEHVPVVHRCLLFEGYQDHDTGRDN
jgi:hypothetical protein